MAKEQTYYIPCPNCGTDVVVMIHHGFDQTFYSPAEPAEIMGMHSRCTCPDSEQLTDEQAWAWLEANQPEPFDDPRIP